MLQILPSSVVPPLRGWGHECGGGGGGGKGGKPGLHRLSLLLEACFSEVC